MRVHLPILLTLAFFAVPLAAQSRPVTQGDTVRFSPEPRGVYIVQEVHGDSLVVSSRNGSERGVSARDRVIFRASGRDHVGGALRGAARGAGAGFVVGAVYGYAQGGDPGYLSAGQKASIGGFLLGALGGFAGAGLGWLNPLTVWDAASSPAATLAPAAPDGRPGVVLTLRF